MLRRVVGQKSGDPSAYFGERFAGALALNRDWRRIMVRLLGFCFLLGTSAAAHATPMVTGNWIIADRSAVITVDHCGAGLCGRISKALIHKPNYPQTDVHNPNPALRSRPLIGLQILSGFRAREDKWDQGIIYDPESGKSYKSIVRLNPDGSLRVSGCVLFFCQSQRWTRN
jgi:uncharacterized protein (DUF2147 family)